MPEITVEWVDEREEIIETEARCKSLVAAYGAFDALAGRSPQLRYRMRDGIRIVRRSYEPPSVPEVPDHLDPFKQPAPKIPGRYRRRFR
jgi:hypothetical protein